MSVNRVMLIGHLGSDPDLQTTKNGKSVCKFTLATSERAYNQATGKYEKKTEWHNIVAWGKTGETCRTYLRKGAKIQCEGSIHYRTYTNKKGIEVEVVEINITEFTFMDSKGSGGGQAAQDRPTAPPTNQPANGKASPPLISQPPPVPSSPKPSPIQQDSDEIDFTKDVEF